MPTSSEHLRGIVPVNNWCTFQVGDKAVKVHKTLTIHYVYQDKDGHPTIHFSKQWALQLFPFFNIQLRLEGVCAICTVKVWEILWLEKRKLPSGARRGWWSVLGDSNATPVMIGEDTLRGGEHYCRLDNCERGLRHGNHRIPNSHRQIIEWQKPLYSSPLPHPDSDY